MTEGSGRRREEVRLVPREERDLEKVAGPLVTVVIPCYNQAHFLGEAIESVLAQTYPHFEVVVVDDGSTDNTQEAAAGYPGVRCIRQENQGLAAARNTGIRHTKGTQLVFLDADDRLLPNALEAGLKALKEHPECAFVAGRYRYIAFDGSPLPTPQPPRSEGDHYAALLRDNHINMHATVMYQRAVFEHVGGFDTTLDSCEDYDLYLRVARDFPIECHDEMVAEYRKHGGNMSRDTERMLRTSVTVLRRQRSYIGRKKQYEAANKMGMRRWQDHYGEQLVGEVVERTREREWRSALRGLLILLRYYPPWQRRSRPPVGRVRFGSLRRLTPINRNFGWGRGGPIDRYYIEDFLARHTEDIRGRVLEIQDSSYTQRFGGDRVTTSDVLDVAENNRQATIHADLTRADHVPSDAFDCIILTQTLHVIYDVHSVARTLYRILKPGGVLLATLPGISQAAQTESSSQRYWGFTILSARRLFEESFPAENVVVENHGNALVATAFLQGLGAGELRPEELEFRDPDYEFLIAIKAVKPGGHNGWSLSPPKNEDG